MKSFEEIRTEIKMHRQHVDYHNRLWEKEGLSDRVLESRELLDQQSTQIYDDIGEHLSSVIEKFNDIGVEIRSVDTITQYKEPYHSFFAKIDTDSYGGHHFKVKGFKYKR